jgi:hypothetical protein
MYTVHVERDKHYRAELGQEVAAIVVKSNGCGACSGNVMHDRTRQRSALSRVLHRRTVLLFLASSMRLRSNDFGSVFVPAQVWCNKENIMNSRNN